MVMDNISFLGAQLMGDRRCFEDVDAHGGLFRAQSAAAVFRQGQTRRMHLPLVGPSPELRDELMDLGQPGGADGMPARDESAAGIYRMRPSMRVAPLAARIHPRPWRRNQDFRPGAARQRPWRRAPRPR